ncbi:MAG: NAD(+)/NADH kinase [Eubacterium sp.]|nr:NAD(+)/NADH kinase [Eubacterium sp.]
MKECKNFLLVVNEVKDADLKYSHMTEESIKKHGGTSSLVVGLDPEKIKNAASGVDAVIVLGGDGTILGLARAMVEIQGVPVIGINLGTVGFMAEVVVSEIDMMLDRLTKGDYWLEERMMICGKAGDKTYHALNDIVVAREDALRIIAVKIYVNGDYFDTTEADGIIISTPTGSTGYNLSAGGPIVKPDAKLLLMTPISPYSMSRRSIVFGMDDKIRLELLEKRKDIENKAIIAYDGAISIPMKVGDTVDIGVSEHTFSIIRLDKSSVYDIIRRKIGG